MNEFLMKLRFDVTSRWHEVRSGERGATAVEYGIMVALIAAVIIVAVGVLGGETNEAFESVNTELQNSTTDATTGSTD